jgi:hypothetical protein
MVICLANPFESMHGKSAGSACLGRLSRRNACGFVYMVAKVNLHVAQMQRRMGLLLFAATHQVFLNGTMIPE